MSKGTLAVISGFSGVGKGTVVKELVRRYPYALSVSATTRDPRPGEVDGVAYHFITKEAFLKKIEEGDFFEYASYVDQYYGTPKSYVLEQLEEGKDVILEIEAEGAFKVKEQMPEALLIYMLPPSMAELKARLVGRGTETPDKVEKRLRKAREEELDKARKYDFLIVNDDLEKCISELLRMIKTRSGISPEDRDVLEKLAGEEA